MVTVVCVKAILPKNKQKTINKANVFRKYKVRFTIGFAELKVSFAEFMVDKAALFETSSDLVHSSGDEDPENIFV